MKRQRHNPQTYENVKKKITIPVTGDPHKVKIKAHGSETINIIGVDQDGNKIPIQSGSILSFDSIIENFKELIVESVKDFAIQYLVKIARDFEINNGETPPPPTPPANVFQQLRQAAKAELGVTREAFDNAMQSAYQVDDEDTLFEEEIIAKKTAEKAQKNERDNNDPSDPDPGNTDDPSASNSETSTENQEAEAEAT